MNRIASHRVVTLSLAMLCMATSSWASWSAVGQAAESTLRVAAFTADITPPVGEPLAAGFCKPVATIEHPLLAKGVVLSDRGGVYVLCSLDSAGLCNDAYGRFRQALAEAAGTSPSRVALHEIQQHTAPMIDSGAQQWLARQEKSPTMATPQYLEAAIAKTVEALRAAMGKRRAVTHVGLGSATVDRVASSRRVRMPDGRIVARMSSTRDAALRNLPEGIIDPKLRTVAFFDGAEPLVMLHYYAMHPQSFYGDGRVSYDVPGLARERLEKETKVPQIYFSGCGGNITMGKYNEGTREARQPLADRLYEAMARSVRAVQREPVSAIDWKVAKIELPLRKGDEFSAERARQTIASAKESAAARIKAAMVLAWIDRVKARRPVEITCLRMGSLRILGLPGDTFIEYQLWAQRAAAKEFVAVAGFGDFGMCYLCTDQAYTDRGGYEQTFTFVDPCESQIKAAIAEVLGRAGIRDWGLGIGG